MHKQVRDVYGHKPRTNRRQANRQFLAWTKMRRLRLSKMSKAIDQQLWCLARNLASIDALIAWGARALVAGRHWCRKLLVISELVRQQMILYRSDTRSIRDRIVSLIQFDIRPIVCGKTRDNVEFGAKISISVSSDDLHSWIVSAEIPATKEKT
ncbi:IS5 family transposase ISSysp4 [Synechococcus sp. CBW1107]|nr:IS5 family transposase ISSysp4 [Synechococcus sp. CBW1107]